MLTLQLNRVGWDLKKAKAKKVADTVKIPLELDMSPFVTDACDPEEVKEEDPVPVDLAPTNVASKVTSLSSQHDGTASANGHPRSVALDMERLSVPPPDRSHAAALAKPMGASKGSPIVLDESPVLDQRAVSREVKSRAPLRRTTMAASPSHDVPPSDDVPKVIPAPGFPRSPVQADATQRGAQFQQSNGILAASHTSRMADQSAVSAGPPSRLPAALSSNSLKPMVAPPLTSAVTTATGATVAPSITPSATKQRKRKQVGLSRPSNSAAKVAKVLVENSQTTAAAKALSTTSVLPDASVGAAHAPSSIRAAKTSTAAAGGATFTKLVTLCSGCRRQPAHTLCLTDLKPVCGRCGAICQLGDHSTMPWRDVDRLFAAQTSTDPWKKPTLGLAWMLQRLPSVWLVTPRTKRELGLLEHRPVSCTELNSVPLSHRATSDNACGIAPLQEPPLFQERSK